MSDSHTQTPAPAARKGQWGFIDVVKNGVVSGWAYDSDTPDHPARVALYVDGKWVGITDAELYRQDLKSQGVRQGRLAFQFTLPERFHDGKQHSVLARFARNDAPFKTTELKFILSESASNPKALQGRNDWLFLYNDSNRCIPQYLGEVALSERQLQHYHTLFQAREAWFAQRNILHYFFIIPGKEYVYAEHLPEGFPKHSRGVTGQLLHYLKNHKGPLPIDLYPVMTAAKSLGQLYYKHDAHWNHLGGFIGARHIMDTLHNHLPHAGTLNRSDYRDREGATPAYDLLGKSQMCWQDGHIIPASTQHEYAPEKDILLQPARGTIAKLVTTPPHLQASRTRETVVYERQDAALPTAIVYHDSFGNWLKPFLAECFRRVAFVWQSDLDFEMIEAERPDIVLQCRVDRFMIQPPSR